MTTREWSSEDARAAWKSERTGRPQPAVHHRDRAVRLREVAGDPCARRPGYFCVDNLPTALIPTLAQLAVRGAFEKAAIVADVREQRFLSTFPATFRKLRTIRRLNPVLIFLEATNDSLVRRFSETRRPHPMGRDKSVIEGIREERVRMAAHSRAWPTRSSTRRT